VRGQALSIRPHEAEFAAGLHGLIRTPRAVKRFTNVYRLLKAPVGSRMTLPGGGTLEDLATFEGSKDAPGTFRVPMVLLALSVGLSEDAADVFADLRTSAVQGLGLHSAIGAATERAANDEVETTLKRLPVDLPDDAETLQRWLPRVARYSFDLGRAVPLPISSPALNRA
ncbi:MAG: hypothetical protein AAGI52_08590, partial [Bacteroidota bacterium]